MPGFSLKLSFIGEPGATWPVPVTGRTELAELGLLFTSVPRSFSTNSHTGKLQMRAVMISKHLVSLRREKLLFKGQNFKGRFLYSLVQSSNVPDRRMFIQSHSLNLFLT